MSKIAIYISGGIAAYKSILVLRELQKQGHEVKVGMTANAQKFVGVQTFAALTHTTVLTDLWDNDHQTEIGHLELAQWCDLALVVPATANIIAKLANGIADDAVTTALIATDKPIIVVPAMNNKMWHNAALQRNIKQLIDDGMQVITPETGYLAEGYQAQGRLPEPDKIVQFVNANLHCDSSLVGKKVVITAGATLEKIDPVRYISNFSSGKMGWAMVQAFLQRGADVTLIYGKVSVNIVPFARLTTIHVASAQEMLTVAEHEFSDADILVMTAAVADFRPKNYCPQKIKKNAGNDSYQLELVKNPDILYTLAQSKNEKQLVVGFAAETNNLLANAHTKLSNKGADMIIANDVSQDVFGSDLNEVTIITKDAPDVKLPRMNKQKIAESIVNHIIKLNSK